MLTHITLAQLVYFVAMFLLVQMTAANLDELEKILCAAVLTCLERSEITVKESAALQGLDESQWRKQLRGEPSHHISLTRLIRLPYKFWLWFAPALMYLIVQKHAQEIAEAVTLRRRV